MATASRVAFRKMDKPTVGARDGPAARMWLLAKEEGCPQEELDDIFVDVLLERYAALQAMAMSHNKVFNDVGVRVIQFISNHENNWYMDRHYMKCREYNQCMCCIARRSYQDDMSCVRCGGVWRLSMISRDMKDHVAAHGFKQQMWGSMSHPPPVIEPAGYEPIDAPGHHAAFGYAPPHVSLTVDEIGEDLCTGRCVIFLQGILATMCNRHFV